MTVNFDIPNGSLTLILNEFLPKAKISQIRKAFKLMPDEKKQETAAWLKEQLECLPAKALSSFMMHREYESRISELKQQVELLKHNPEEKEQLNETKMQLSQCRRLSTQYRRKSEEISKLKKRYEDITEKLEIGG